MKGSTLKESLILKKLTGRKSYSFKIEAEGLRAEVQTDNSVHFYAEGAEEPVFVVAAPYMFDAAGEYSSAVAVQLKKTGNHYRYTLTPDRAWLEAGERVWPVTVDPTIQTKQDFGSLKSLCQQWASRIPPTIISESCIPVTRQHINTFAVTGM